MNLVASGASESEIFIWDLNNPDKPMTPGAKAQVCTWYKNWQPWLDEFFNFAVKDNNFT